MTVRTSPGATWSEMSTSVRPSRRITTPSRVSPGSGMSQPPAIAPDDVGYEHRHRKRKKGRGGLAERIDRNHPPVTPRGQRNRFGGQRLHPPRPGQERWQELPDRNRKTHRGGGH